MSPRIKTNLRIALYMLFAKDLSGCYKKPSCLKILYSGVKMSEKKISIGIIGVGMVGEPKRRWFEEVQNYKRGRELFLYDADPKKGYFDDVNKADVIFVSVPTPPNPDGSCNVSIVKSAV